jgi:hypothetical protein
MAQASASIRLPALPDEDWHLIGRFGSLPDWLPFISRSELREGGRVRHLATADGAAIIERLLTFNEAERSYSYAILQSPFPVTNYVSTLRVRDSDGGSCIEWSGQLTPNGVSDTEATLLFQGIYEDGLNALAADFSTRKQ